MAKTRRRLNKKGTRKYFGGNHITPAEIDHAIDDALAGMNLTDAQETKVRHLLKTKLLPGLTFDPDYQSCNSYDNFDDDDYYEYSLRDQATAKARCWIEFCLDKPKFDAIKNKSKNPRAEPVFLTRYFGKTATERNLNNPAAKAHHEEYGHMLRSDPDRPKSPDVPASPGEEESVRSKSPAPRSASEKSRSASAKVDEIRPASHNVTAKIRTPTPKKRGLFSRLFSRKKN